MPIPSLILDYQQKHTKLWQWVALALAIIVCGIAISFYIHLDNKFSALETRDRQRQQKAALPKPVTGNDAVAVKKKQNELAYASKVLQQLSLPWADLFKAVEASTVDGVALLGMQPDMQKGVVNISAEAKQFPEALTYITRLEASQAFSEVYLVSHEIRQNDPQRPILFTVTARWKAKE